MKKVLKKYSTCGCSVSFSKEEMMMYDLRIGDIIDLELSPDTKANEILNPKPQESKFEALKKEGDSEK